MKQMTEQIGIVCGLLLNIFGILSLCEGSVSLPNSESADKENSGEIDKYRFEIDISNIDCQSLGAYLSSDQQKNHNEKPHYYYTPIENIEEKEDVEIDIVARCLEDGRKFLHKFVRRRNEQDGGNKCRLFARFRSCFLPIYEKCYPLLGGGKDLDRHSIEDIDRKDDSSQLNSVAFLQHWMAIVEHMDCSCKKSKECRRGQECMFNEVYEFWGRRCNDYYRQNLHQNFSNICHFLEEKLECKLALVRSACDERTALFSAALLRVSSLTEFKQLGCDFYQSRDRRPRGQYSVFSYTSGCRRQFIDEMDKCTSMLTEDRVLSFTQTNDLIPTTTNNRELRKACKTVRKYEDCLRPLNESCPVGMRQVFDYQHELRIYMLKMSYICRDDVLPDIRRDLGCMQRLLNDSGLKPCEGAWQRAMPLQAQTTVYQFYCQPDNINTINYKRALETVGECHESLFRASCNSSQHLRELFRRAFNDPFYLRFSYKPDCQSYAVAIGEDPGLPLIPRGDNFPNPTTTDYISRDRTMRLSNSRTVASSSNADSGVGYTFLNRPGAGVTVRQISGAGSLIFFSFFNLSNFLCFMLILLQFFNTTYTSF